MSETLVRPRYVKKIAELTPGLAFRYQVWANKSLQGDFGDSFSKKRTAVHEFWTVAAEIIGDEETEVAQGHRRELIIGQRAVFNVFNPHSLNSIQESQGIILPRATSPVLTSKQLGEYPIQEGFSTELNDFRVNCEEVSGRFIIPRRNIRPGSLRILSSGFSN